jgi:hypothetical protein
MRTQLIDLQDDMPQAWKQQRKLWQATEAKPEELRKLTRIIKVICKICDAPELRSATKRANLDVRSLSAATTHDLMPEH